MSSKSATAFKLKKSSSVDDLRADVASLRDDLKAVMLDLRGVANDSRRQAFVTGKSWFNEAGDRAGEAQQFVQSSVRNQPLRAIGASFVAGLLIAALRGR